MPVPGAASTRFPASEARAASQAQPRSQFDWPEPRRQQRQSPGDARTPLLNTASTNLVEPTEGTEAPGGDGKWGLVTSRCLWAAGNARR